MKRHAKLALFGCSTIPLNGALAIFDNSDSCPVSIPECHLRRLIPTVGSKCVVKLGLGLIDRYDVMVTCCMKESEVALRGCVS